MCQILMVFAFIREIQQHLLKAASWSDRQGCPQHFHRQAAYIEIVFVVVFDKQCALANNFARDKSVSVRNSGTNV
jgi:hypothetical protein